MIDLRKEIIQAGNNNISVENLYDALKEIQIEEGDILCVHSQIFNLGKSLIERTQFLETLVRVLQDLVGTQGMLIMPTFSYSFCKNEVYDVQNTPSLVGVLTEFFRNMPEVRRTAHPIFSFALWGERTEFYLDIGPDAFGLDSVYGKMIRDKGKILMFGANKGYTFYHLAEEHVNVGHRYFKNFSGKVRDERGRTYDINVPYFVRNLSIKSDLDEIKLSKFLLENECQQQIEFAKGTLAVVDCRRTYTAIVQALRENERRFL